MRRVWQRNGRLSELSGLSACCVAQQESRPINPVFLQNTTLFGRRCPLGLMASAYRDKRRQIPGERDHGRAFFRHIYHQTPRQNQWRPNRGTSIQRHPQDQLSRRFMSIGSYAALCMGLLLVNIHLRVSAARRRRQMESHNRGRYTWWSQG